MNLEENQIIGEDYADLLIETYKVKDIVQKYPQATAYPINPLLSLVNIPVDFITNYTAMELGYSVFPAILGLLEQGSMNVSKVQKLREIQNYNLRGQGVFITIIDTGIDYTNPIFRYVDGTTRIAVIWDQTIQSGNPPNGFLYGTEYTKEQINQALQSENPYEIVPSKDEIGHGTMIAGIAGGKEVPESNFYGVAPNVEFIVVKLKPAKKYLRKFFCIPEDAIGYQENDLAFAFNYVINKLISYDKPSAICLSINSSEGPHDGRGTLNDYISYMAVNPGIAVVAGAGNEGNAKRHFFGGITGNFTYNTAELNVGENEENFTMQLWGNISVIFSIDITTPSGERITYITQSRNEFKEITFSSLKTTIYLDYQTVEPQSGVQLVFFRFINPDSGIWKLTINKTSNIDFIFHIWLPMEGFISDSTFFINSDPYTTVLSLATIDSTIKATAYNMENDELYQKASKGYSRIGLITPDIAAPGVDMIGPTIDNFFASFTGTSVSAAYMTGVAAMMLEWGIVKDNNSSMNSVSIRNMVCAGAKRKENITYPNQDWGYGILDISNVFNNLWES